MSATPTYEVHLTDVPNVPKHVETDEIRYYDSGIWVATDDGRTFFPWGRVTMIREPAGDGEPEAEGTALAAEEEEAAAEGEEAKEEEPATEED